MKAHLTDTHLLVPWSRSSAKVKVKYQGHVSQKMGVLGALVFHKHTLFYFIIFFTLAMQTQPLTTLRKKHGFPWPLFFFNLEPQIFQRTIKIQIFSFLHTFEGVQMCPFWKSPGKSLKKAIEIIVENGENAGNQHFLLFQQCFLLF